MPSHLGNAKRHLEKLKYYFDNHTHPDQSEVVYHYNKLGECYRKSTGGDQAYIHMLYLEGKKLMDSMKRREKGLPELEPFDGYDKVRITLNNNGFPSVEVNPVMEDVGKVGIIFGDDEAFGDMDEILAAIEAAEDGDLESLKSECKDRELLD